MRRTLVALLVLGLSGSVLPLLGAETSPAEAVVRGLSLRSIGPALMGGRIADIAVDPRNRSTWYLAVGSGGVWKTENAGTTWTPIFDDYPSYSIGCITLDPNQPDTVWVGTGENVSGRHVGWGDGVYKTLDGGRSWKQVGLEASEHIAKIVVDPRDSDVVFAAAEGPLWASGGDRGLYRTTDGGESWERVLNVDDDTGVTDLEFDPRNPDVLLAATYQRRRHVWSLLAGGPGSGIYKSTDGGTSWREVTAGLPTGDMGKIGLAISPADPDVVYATIEADEEERGFYRSLDGGESWSKRNSYLSNGTGPHYYQEIEASPHDVGTVYQMDVFLHVTHDGGATFEIVGDGRQKHSDNHALVIDPLDPEHLLAGTDASLYESFDGGTTWRQFPNLPISQFYKLALDNAEPFYNILGGAQDLGTLHGPSRTRNLEGVRNRDWFVPLGADGYDCVFDPDDPNLFYLQWQRGRLQRYDLQSDEAIDIQPQPAAGEPPERWNWDSPLIVSPHSSTRLYFGSHRLWRSDDRGNSWRAVSDDLTQGQNRYEMEFLGRVWSVDSLYDNAAMSWFATTTTISESPLVEGLLYVGTDDGLLQVTEDGGASWRSAGAFPTVPEWAFVNEVQASLHDADTVFAAVDAHKTGDFRPLLFRSNDRGQSWQSIAGDLRDDGIVWSIEQDAIEKDLLFVGTEFGVSFSADGGGRWFELSSGVPTISFRDLEVHHRDGDLVGATFGRGFYVLDDYTPLRSLVGGLDGPAHLFPVRDAWSYIPEVPMQARGQPSLGSSYFTAPNPAFGALLSYYLEESVLTPKEARRAKEREMREQSKDVPFPGWEQLADEAVAPEPSALVVVRNAQGEPVRRIEGPASAGLHRVSWDLRLPPPDPVDLSPAGFRPPWASDPRGPLAPPGEYSAELYLFTGQEVQHLAEPVSFQVKSVAGSSLPSSDPSEIAAFQAQTRELLRRAQGVREEIRHTEDRLRHLRAALTEAPGTSSELFVQLGSLERQLATVRQTVVGDPILSRWSEPATPSVLRRLGQVAGGHWDTTQAPTTTQRQSLEVAERDLGDAHRAFQTLLEETLPDFEALLEAAGAPWTPGRRVPAGRE